MKCPSCGAPFEAPTPRCPQCKFSLAKADARYGLVPRHSRFLTDRSGLLTRAEVQEIRGALRLFYKRFPQALFTILVTELPTGSAVAEFVFWMANRANFTSADKLRGENFNLLLVIDLTSKAAALTSGYGLEPHVPEEVFQETLNDFAAAFDDRGLAEGLRVVIDSLTNRLRELAAKKQATEPKEARTGVDSW